MKAPKWRWLDAVQSTAGPRSTVRHLCLCLASHMDADGERCFPGMRLIAEEMGVRLGTVSVLVREAKAAGWLDVEERRKGRRGGTFFVYRPAIPDPESVQETGTLQPFSEPERCPRQSVPPDARSVPVHAPEAFCEASLSSSVVPQGVPHGTVPSVLNAGDEVPTDGAEVVTDGAQRIRRLRVNLGHLGTPPKPTQEAA